MNEYLMRAYLRSRKGLDDEEFVRRMRDALSSERYARGREMRGMRRDSRYNDLDNRMFDDFYVNRHSDSQLSDIMDDLDATDREKLFKMMLGEEGTGSHFNEDSAKYIVSNMYHTSGGRKYTGEKFDMHKAKEICERYRGILPTSVTPTDVYVAINSQYHDYAELFKNWFGNDIEQKIVESAIVFWFKDADAKSENKLIEYFKGH